MIEIIVLNRNCCLFSWSLTHSSRKYIS